MVEPGGTVKPLALVVLFILAPFWLPLLINAVGYLALWIAFSCACGGLTMYALQQSGRGPQSEVDHG